ncbi:MAG: hypothetical protein U0414_18560 [Polyangiaceae bacterium]
MAGAKDRDDPGTGIPRIGVEWDEESTADERKKLTRAIDASQLLKQVGERAPPPGFFPQKPPVARPSQPEAKTPVSVPAARRQGLRVDRRPKEAPSVPVPSFVDDESTADGQTRILKPDVEVFIDEASLTGDELAAIEAERS